MVKRSEFYVVMSRQIGRADLSDRSTKRLFSHTIYAYYRTATARLGAECRAEIAADRKHSKRAHSRARRKQAILSQEYHSLMAMVR